MLFRNALDLVEELEIAEMKGELKKKLQKLAKVDALMIDELGVFADESAGALRAVPADQPVLRVPVADHHHQQGLNQLGGGHDDNVAVPIIDRIIHHSHLYLLGGESNRLKQ